MEDITGLMYRQWRFGFMPLGHSALGPNPSCRGWLSQQNLAD